MKKTSGQIKVTNKRSPDEVREIRIYKQIGKQRRDQKLDRERLRPNEEIGKKNIHGLPEFRPGASQPDNIPHINERTKEDIEATLRDSRHTDFQDHISPQRQISRFDEVGDASFYDSFIRRRIHLLNILAKTEPTRRTQMATLKAFAQAVKIGTGKRSCWALLPKPIIMEAIHQAALTAQEDNEAKFESQQEIYRKRHS